MRRRVFRCVLLALLAAFSAVPAAAGTIVGEFYFQLDSGFCDPTDPTCEPFEVFYLANTYVPVDALDPLVGLSFSAVIQVDEIDYVDQFFYGLPLASGEFDFTLGLPSTSPFFGGGKASLIFNGNFADYFGTLSLSNEHGNVLYDDGSASPPFSAQVIFTPNGPVGVPEVPSSLVVVIALSALVVGRAFFV